MVIYTKNSGRSRPFRKPYKELSHRDLTAVLARMGTKHFDIVRTLARHYSGTHPIPGVQATLRRKLLPSSLTAIANTEYPKHLNSQLVAEEQKHADSSLEFHKGGGIATALQDLFSVAWDQLKAVPVAGPLVSWLEGKVSNPWHGEKITDDNKDDIDVLTQAYKSMDDRVSKIHGWLHLPKYDSDYACVYYNPKEKAVHIGIRGSHSLHDWWHHNTQILTSNKAGWQTVAILREYLMEISNDFPNQDLTVVGHSLSATMLKDVIGDATPKQTEVLNNIDSILMVNPGSSPIGDDSSIRAILKDDRLKLFLNKSDIISSTFNTLLTEDVNFSYGEPMSNPLSAHNYRQFTSGDLEENKEVEWGAAPFEEGAPTTWEVGADTQQGFSDFATADDTI